MFGWVYVTTALSHPGRLTALLVPLCLCLQNPYSVQKAAAAAAGHAKPVAEVPVS